MPVFHLMENFPLGGDRWRIVFARDQSPVGPGTVGQADLQPPSPYQITLYVYCVDRTVWTKAMTAANP